MHVQGRFSRDGGHKRRITLAWRNHFTSWDVPMKQRTFSLAAESLGHVHKVHVERALVFLKTGNSLIHERSLVQLTFNGQRNEVTILSDPQIAGGVPAFSTCSCVLPATGDLGIGSYSFIYAAPQGPVTVMDRSDCGGTTLTDVDMRVDFPLYPSLPDSEIAQVVITLVLE